MVTSLASLKDTFDQRVAPHFPQAKERFARYFQARVDLIKKPPFMFGTDWDSRPLATFPIEYAFAVMGLKPLSMIQEWRENSYHFMQLNWLNLQGAGLGYRFRQGSDKCDGGAELYDPVLLAPIVSARLNRHVTAEKVREALSEMEKLGMIYSHDMLGYPQKHPGYWFAPGLITGIRGEVIQMKRRFKFSSTTGCAISDIEAGRETMPARAFAASLVQKIRGVDGESYCKIMNWKPSGSNEDIHYLSVDG